MNKLCLAGLLLLAIAPSGCSGKEEKSAKESTNAPTATGNPITAPVDYLGSVAKAKKVSEKTIDTASLNQAVQLFQASEGRLPKDLNELVTEKYLTRLPDAPYGMKIVYDGSTGQVKVVPR